MAQKINENDITLSSFLDFPGNAGVPATPTSGFAKLYGAGTSSSMNLGWIAGDGNPYNITGGLKAWTTYTPTWTAVSVNPAINNGTIAGKYIQIGKTVTAKIEINAGTTTSFGTGLYAFGLPTATTNERWIGSGMALRTGTFIYIGPAMNTDVNITVTTGTVSILQSGTVIGSATAAWANGDKFVAQITYEVP